MKNRIPFFFKALFFSLQEEFHLIHIKLNTITMNQADFDAKLATLQPKIDKVKADTEALIAKANASGVDLTAEATTLQTSLDALDAIDAEANPAPAPAV
jgi:hypothetical protein